MGMLSKEQIKAMIEHYGIETPEDISSALKDMFGEALSEILNAELDTELGYEHGEKAPKNTSNRRNGKTRKTVRSSEFGDVDIAVPRDREGSFEPQIVKKNQKSVTGIEERIIAMYAKGMSTRDIEEHLRELYGIEASPTLVSNVTNKLLPVIQDWQSRPLEEVYAIVFMDAIHYKVRQDGHIRNKAAYIVLGIDLEGKKDILGIWIGESESSKFWLSVLNDLKNRGCQDILIASVDNLRGFSQAIEAAYPQAQIQKCVIHQIRSSTRFVGYKDLKAVTADLKPIYKASTEEAGLLELERFEEKWNGKYPIIAKSWRDNWTELSTFFQYPPELRKIIYTTNIIEGFHRQLRKATKTKSVFPSDESLMKMLFLVAKDVSKKWTMRVPNWGLILSQLVIFFGDRVSCFI